MTETGETATRWLARASHQPFAYLTTTGRRSGRPHRIEIWFAVEDNRLYMMSGGHRRADWVRNLQANPQVTVELDGETREGAARIVQAGTREDARARELLVEKYRAGNNLDEWGKTALPVVVTFAGSELPSSHPGGQQVS